jgi:uncharacterized MAPEG superfamily protein
MPPATIASLPTELSFLLLTAILASSLWIPFIVGVNTTEWEGSDEAFVRAPDISRMKPWVQRAFRAHLNLLEQFLPYAVIVLIGHIAGVSNGTTRICAIVFFVLRVVHAVGMITALARFPVRPIIFTSGWVVSIVHAYQVLAFAGHD